jgi:predicted nucleic acid-binding Zn ribbon protein
VNRCQNCGSPLEPHQTRCPQCGHLVAPPIDFGSRRPAWTWLQTIGVLLLILVAVPLSVFGGCLALIGTMETDGGIGLGGLVLAVLGLGAGWLSYQWIRGRR